MSESLSSQPPARRSYLPWLLYGLAALALVALLIRSTLDELARNPSRDATADLSPYELATIRFNTSPYPPLPTGTVTLSFMPMDSRRHMVPVDAMTYEYGQAGSDQPFGSGEAPVMSDGSGMFMGSARFANVGNWWVRVNVRNGQAQAQVRFTVNVKPAQ
jgi:hypothetical protein